LVGWTNFFPASSRLSCTACGNARALEILCVRGRNPELPHTNRATTKFGRSFDFIVSSCHFCKIRTVRRGWKLSKKGGKKNIAHPTKEPSPSPITQMPRAGARAATERAVAARPLERTRGMRTRGECIRFWRGVSSKRGV